MGFGADDDQHTAVSVFLLGGFRMVRGQNQQVEVRASAQRLIALLALRSPVARTQIAGTLWPEVDEQRAYGSLRTCVWQLRRYCPELLCSHRGNLKLSDAVQVDTIGFESYAHRILGEPYKMSFADLTREITWRELLPDWYDEWVLLERERYRQVQLHVLEATGEELLRRREPGYALSAALAAIQAEPLRESAHRLLIRIHISEGNACEAIRHYKWYRRTLRDELGVSPTEQLKNLVADLPILAEPGAAKDRGVSAVSPRSVR